MAADENALEPEDTGATATAEGDDAFKFVEDPVFDVDYKGDCAYEVKVTVPAANSKQQTVEAFDELKQHAELPGFRKGRAPVKLLEKKFGKMVRDDVNGKLANEAFQKLVKDQELKPSGYPDVDGLEEMSERGDDDPLEFTLKFEVAPRVELGKYRGVEVERPVVKIDDQDVQESIDATLERQAVYEELAGGVAAEGDQVIIDFSGTVGGEEFSGGSAENYPYILGSQRFFPEFEKKLLGSSPGDNLKCKVTFPDDYFAEELRGKKADFKIKVNEVKRKSIPKLSAKFAKEAGFEGIKDMKEKVKEQLREASSGQSNQVAEARALEAVIEDSKFEISPAMIEALTNQHREQEVMRLMQARTPKAVIEEQMDAIDAAAREGAIRSIKSMVVLNQIGEAEDVEVTDEDFEKQAQTMAQSIGADVEMVAQYMAQDDQRGSYLGRIYREKALAVIMDNAKVTDKELTREEMEEAGKAEASKGE